MSSCLHWFGGALFDHIFSRKEYYYGHRSPLSILYNVLAMGIMPLSIVANGGVSKRKSYSKKMFQVAAVKEAELDDLEDELLAESLRLYLKRKKLSRMRKDAVLNRTLRQRKSWSKFESKLTDRQFRRYFRMPRECFEYLCERIKENVGEHEFKSEQYLKDYKNGDAGNKLKFANILHAHEATTGGFICGEIKLALTLRLLAGGSYLDLALLFETGFTYAIDIFHDVIEKWILDDRLVKISGIDYCSDIDRMEKVAFEFSRGSNGVINGCIGAIDGWIVKIIKPSKTRDGVKNPASFFSRKGFFGINVQAIVDKKKRILYRQILSRGAEHDSTAFKNGALYQCLMNNWRFLALKGLYFIGDSAYALKSFLLTPFDNVLHGTSEDNFNFFHSSSRISVECAFGEIDLRWGIL